MPKRKAEQEIARIEEAQRALRESIDRTKELAEEADKLIQVHKKSLKDTPDNE